MIATYVTRVAVWSCLLPDFNCTALSLPRMFCPKALIFELSMFDSGRSIDILFESTNRVHIDSSEGLCWGVTLKLAAFDPSVGSTRWAVRLATGDCGLAMSCRMSDGRTRQGDFFGRTGKFLKHGRQQESKVPSKWGSMVDQ